jgi:Glycosyl transferase family 11
MSKRKIIVRMIGGLGNQLFQLQYAILLNEKIGGIIILDDSFLAASSKPHENLAIINLFDKYDTIRLNWIDLNLKRVIERIFNKLKNKVPKIFRPSFLFENTDIDLENLERVVVDGFWQDVTYMHEPFIKSVRKLIINETSFDYNQARSVCVHIRRGDYLTNKHWGKLQQITVPLDYYLQAFKLFENTVNIPFFDIYTDDEKWALETFGNKTNLKVVQSKKLSPLELLTKMSGYHNFIIANSTLSWWAAVLSVSPIKIVVMPKKWGVNTESKKFQLPGWIVI